MSSSGYNTQQLSGESGEKTGDEAIVKLNGVSIETPLAELEDVGHPLVPEVKQDYIMREINGQPDLKVLAYAISDPDFFAMLEGEAATGKNFSIDTLLASANWPRIRVNFGINSSYSSLVGRFAPTDNTDVEGETFDRAEVIDRVANRLASQNRDGNEYDIAKNAIPEASTFQWIDGLLTKAVKNGWAFVGDEINGAEPEALMPLNGLTEDRENRYLTIEETSEIIKPHTNFRFIATRNPMGYAGVGDMNSALESRAYIIPFGYHEKDALEEILRNRTPILENESESALETLVDMAGVLRQMEQQDTEIVTKVSTRTLIKIGRLTDIMSIRNACRTILMGIADPTDENAIKSEINGRNF